MKILANKIPKKVKKLSQKIINRGFDCFLVGGCVRDLILKRPVKDWDITTNATPNDLKKIFKNESLIDVNSSLGTLIVNGIEITTFRKDGKYSNNRRPNKVQWAKTLNEDIKRRDLTINGLAIDLNGNVIDLVGGLSDIKNKKIKCIGNPNERFKEDALRILRAIRFSSVLDFNWDFNTLLAAKKNKNLLKTISKERIREELNKLICGKNFYGVGLLFKDVFFAAIPKLSELDVEHNNPHHYLDVYGHTLLCVQNVQSNDYIDKMAALLHDIGKKQCKSIDCVTYYNHFYGHADKSVEIARQILNELKYSNEDKNKILWLIKQHHYNFNNNIRSLKKWLFKIPHQWDKWEMLNRLLILKKADREAVSNIDNEDNYDEVIKSMTQKIINEDNVFKIKDLEVDGYDVIKFGFKGKEIGIILKDLLNKVIDHKIPNKRERLLNEIGKKNKKVRKA